jgi:hypothetical protein
VVTEGGAVAGWLESQHGMCSELVRLSNAASSVSVLIKPALRTKKHSKKYELLAHFLIGNLPHLNQRIASKKPKTPFPAPATQPPRVV